MIVDMKERIILIPKSRKLAGKLHMAVESGSIKKPISKEIAYLRRELTPEELKQALRLANVIPCQQRPDLQLLKTMRMKRSRPFDSVSKASFIPSYFPATSQSLQPTSPKVTRVVDWETEALKGIKKHNLSLDLEWSHTTWKNKANNLERLKLLKDDGFDIDSLKTKAATSNQIVQAVIDRVKLRKQQTAVRRSPPSELARCVDSQESDREPRGSIVPRNRPILGISKHCRLGLSALALQKRKHESLDDYKQIWGVDNQSHDRHVEPPAYKCGPARKKRRLATPAQTNTAMKNEAFDQFKYGIIREIFRSPWRTRSTSGTPSPVDTSYIVFSSDPSSSPRPTADVLIGSRGFTHILDEIKWLSQEEDNGGALYIHDPEVAETQKFDSLREGKADLQEFSGIAPGELGYIRISQRPNGRTTMQGDALALAGLMDRLCKHDLIHMSNLTFDGMRVVRENVPQWGLSDDTKKALAIVQSMLEADAGHGAVGVKVEQVYNGKRLLYD